MRASAIGTTTVRRRPLKGRWRRYLTGYVLIAPALVAAGLFLYVPIVLSGYWSLTEYSGLGEPEWVGLANYVELFGNELFLKALLNTFLFVLLGMGIGPVLGFLSALLLNSTVRFRGSFRAAYFIPVMTSLVVVATIWKILLQEDGLINQILSLFGLPGHPWLSDPTTALPSVVVTSIWQGFGFETVVFLAALQGIPRELYDAAKVDGASYWQQVRHITLPAMRPTIMFVYIIGIIGSFQVYDQIFVMTDGGPINSTRTLVFDLVDRFQQLELGEASAVAYVLLAILAVLSYVQIFVFERERA
ncbi:MAG TPA: sugar ABC transporter permease [Actinomycetota bacterium]|nr:sugar ABC transporter permease [Actinomycetota bacterium]